jgi:ribosomal protein S27E
MKASDCQLDVKTNEVICQECGQAIDGISVMMRQALKNAGQIVRSAARKAFMTNCNNCKANREVVLNKETTNTTCKTCGNAVSITPQMKNVMIELSKANSEE